MRGSFAGHDRVQEVDAGGLEQRPGGRGTSGTGLAQAARLTRAPP